MDALTAQMVQKIAAWTLVGAAAGTAIGFLSEMKRRRQEAANDLGFEWAFAKADQHMAQALNALKAFRQVDEQAYYEVGQACDAIASLHALLQDPSTDPQHFWSYKSYCYRQQITKALQGWSKKVMQAPAHRWAQRGGGRQPQGQSQHQHQRARGHPAAAWLLQRPPQHGHHSPSPSPTEFNAAADALYRIVDAYHWNIVTELSRRHQPLCAAPEPPSEQAYPPAADAGAAPAPPHEQHGPDAHAAALRAAPCPPEGPCPRPPTQQ